MTFYFSKILDEGTSNPIVARIGVQLRELLKICKIDQNRKEDLDLIFHEMMKSIVNADKQATPLIEELKSIENDPIKHGFCLERGKCAVPSSLKLENTRIFLKFAHETLRLLAQALAVFFGKGWTEAKFDPILKHIEQEQTVLDETWVVALLVKENLKFFDHIHKLRNVEEHKLYTREKKSAFIENYKLLNVEGQMNLISPELYDGTSVLPFLIDANQRIFQLTEEIIVSTIALFLPEPVDICEIPESERREDCPRRFRHCLGVPLPPVVPG